MSHPADYHDIVATAESVISETRAIDETLRDLQRRVNLRKAAAYRLAQLVDVHVEVNGGDLHASAIEDAVLLEIYRAGEAGADRSHLKAALRHRYGPHFGTGLLDMAIRALVSDDKVIDRDGTVFAPIRRIAGDTTTGTPKTIKARVIQLLEQHATGLKTAEISRAFSTTGVDISVHTISPVLSRLKKLGKVRHDGTYWQLIRG